MNYPYNPNEDQHTQPKLWLVWLVLIVLIALYASCSDDNAASDERNAATAFYPSRPSVEQQTAYREEMQAQADLIRTTANHARGAQ